MIADLGERVRPRRLRTIESIEELALGPRVNPSVVCSVRRSRWFGGADRG